MLVVLVVGVPADMRSLVDDENPLAGTCRQPLREHAAGEPGADHEIVAAAYLVGVCSGRLPRRRARGAQGFGGRQEGHRRRRRHQDPAGRHLDRGLQEVRADGRAGHEGARSATRRTSSRPTSARRSPRTRSRRARRCSSRSPAAAASARSRRPTRPACWGIGVDVDQYNAREARADERREARRQRRLPGDPGREGGQVQGRHGPALQPEERRHRPSARSTRP